VRVSAKADYAVRAMIELASGGEEGNPIKGDRIAEAQAIPLRFLENILGELRHAGLVQSRRGTDGGYWLAKPRDDITVADIVRAVEGPLATVRGEPADELTFEGGAKPLREVWIALRANIREILESVTLADVVADKLPEPVRAIAAQPDVWQAR
jgi:Rrf2 family protein